MPTNGTTKLYYRIRCIKKFRMTDLLAKAATNAFEIRYNAKQYYNKNSYPALFLPDSTILHF